MNTMVTISELQRVGMYPMAISRSVKKQKLGNYKLDPVIRTA